MKHINISVVHAFSVNGTGGNPARIVFNADDLSTELKQLIATAAGFPETAFVSGSAFDDFKLDFFTPLKQIPHCGHATIASFSLMRQREMIKADESSKETIDGCRITRFRGDKAFMEQLAPKLVIPTEYFVQILEMIEETIAAVRQALRKLSPELLEKDFPVAIFENKTSTEYMLIHLATHLGYHLGQINYHRRLLDL